MNKLKSKIATLNNSMLIEIVKGLNTSFGAEQDMVFDAALGELETRLQENEFIQL